MKTLAKNLIFLLASTSWTAPGAFAPYSPEPYRNPPLDSTAAGKMLEGLRKNFFYTPERVTAGNVQQVREAVYVAIDGFIKSNPSYIDSLPYGHVALRSLFASAGGMGVWGATAVAAELDTNFTRNFADTAMVRNGFRLEVDGTRIQLKSQHQGWSLTFPYHFMVSNVQRYKDKFGYMSEIAIVSTGFAKQAKPPGYSQATLMVVVSERTDVEFFIRDWSGAFGGSRLMTPCFWELSGYSCHSREDAGGSAIRANLYFAPHGSQSILIAYTGLPETFTHNQPHARDFINTLTWDD